MYWTCLTRLTFLQDSLDEATFYWDLAGTPGDTWVSTRIHAMPTSEDREMAIEEGRNQAVPKKKKKKKKKASPGPSGEEQTNQDS